MKSLPTHVATISIDLAIEPLERLTEAAKENFRSVSAEIAEHVTDSFGGGLMVALSEEPPCSDDGIELPNTVGDLCAAIGLPEDCQLLYGGHSSGDGSLDEEIDEYEIIDSLGRPVGTLQGRGIGPGSAQCETRTWTWIDTNGAVVRSY